MFEMSNSCEDHGDLMVVSGLNDLFIADRSAGLDHSSCTGTDRFQQSVSKREERIGCHNTSL